MATAIATNDRAQYDWSGTTLDEAVNRVTPQGTLPLEMDRGQRALHYHLFALAPIVMMAEFEAANGTDAYVKKDNAIRRLVQRTVNGLTDNSFFTEQAHVAQDTPAKPNENKSEDVLWLVSYLKRFPDEATTKILHTADLHPFNYIGGYPPGWPGNSL